MCLLHRLTGLPCLTCGGTRAITALLKGDWLDALRIQPLVSALSVLLVGWLAANIFCWLVWRQCLSVTLSRTEWLILGMAALLLAVSNWVYLLWHGV